MTLPYTYLIEHIPSGKKYYGVRFAKGCHPSDLWNKYFTSSKIVERLIEEDGINSFRFEIRKTFLSDKEATDWECKVLRRLKVISKELWLNNNEGHANLGNKTFGMLGKKHSKETKELMSSKQKGQNNPMFGKTHSEENKIKISNAGLGRTHTEETKIKMSVSKKGKPFTGTNSNSPETIAKRAASNKSKGHKRSDEQKARMSASHLGKKPSEETKAKMREAQLKRWAKSKGNEY